MTFLVRTAVTPRVRQLQSDQKPLIRSRNLSMFLEQRRFQPCQSCFRLRSRQKLIRIRAPFMADGDGFAAPNQFCPAASESLPPANRMLAGIAVASTVPSFHRLNSEAIADPNAFAKNRLRQWRFQPVKKLLIARNGQAQCVEMCSEPSDTSNSS